MSRPLEQKDLDNVVEALKGHIDDKFEIHKVHFVNLKENVDRHELEIYGKDRPGLKIKVDRIQTEYKIIKRVMLGASALITSIGAYLGFK